MICLGKLIQYGFEAGLVKIIDSPQGDGAVCKIGDYWFYFGGQTAESMTAEKYLRDIPRNDIIREIVETLVEFSKDLEGFSAEYAYYTAFLKEGLVGKFRAKKTGSDEYVVGNIFIADNRRWLCQSNDFYKVRDENLIDIDVKTLVPVDIGKDPAVEIHINVEGGLVTDVYSNLSSDKITLYIMDHDTDDADEQEAAEDALNGCVKRVRSGSLFCVY